MDNGKVDISLISGWTKQGADVITNEEIAKKQLFCDVQLSCQFCKTSLGFLQGSSSEFA